MPVAPRVTVALKVPDPMLVKVTGPDTVSVARLMVALVTVSVVEMVVAAFAMAPARIARAHVFMIRVIEVSSVIYTPENITERLKADGALWVISH